MSMVTFVEQSVAPSAPAVSRVVLYAKTDSLMYYKDDNGIEHVLNAALIAAGSQTASTGTVVFSNSNGVTFGMSGSTRVTASVDAVRSISAGTSNATGSQVVFSNSNGISFGANGATMTAQMPSLSFIQNLKAGPGVAINQFTTSSLSMQRISFPFQLNATRMDMVFNISNSSSAGASIQVRVGLYTMSASTASLASSGSRSFAYNSTLAGSSYTDVSGARYKSVTLGTWSITPGEYLFGMVISALTALTAQTVSIYGDNPIGAFAEEYQNSTIVTRPYFGAGALYSAGTTALPNSIQLSELTQMSSSAAGNGVLPPIPWFGLIGTF